MKIIDLLNKIANGEIETYTKFVYDNKIMNVEYLIDNYLFLCILNDEVKIINNKKILQFDKEKVNIENSLLEEEKKMPENLPFNNEMRLTIMEVYHELEKYNYKINEIIDYLKSKGE